MAKSTTVDKEALLKLAELAEITIPAENLESVMAHFTNAALMYNEMCILNVEESELEPAPVFQLPENDKHP